MLFAIEFDLLYCVVFFFINNFSNISNMPLFSLFFHLNNRNKCNSNCLGILNVYAVQKPNKSSCGYIVGFCSTWGGIVFFIFWFWNLAHHQQGSTCFSLDECPLESFMEREDESKWTFAGRENTVASWELGMNNNRCDGDLGAIYGWIAIWNDLFVGHMDRESVGEKNISVHQYDVNTFNWPKLCCKIAFSLLFFWAKFNQFQLSA